MEIERKVKKIGIVFNLKKKGGSDDQQEEYDEIETIESLKTEIEKYGFQIILFEQKESFLKEIQEERPDFVLNIAEGIGNNRARESQVPCILESLGIPYSGSDPLSLGMALDKHVTHRILKSAGIPVPLMFMVGTEQEVFKLKKIFKLKKSFIVKPRWEGSSKGIFLNSVVERFKELKERIMDVLLKYKQPAIVEEFLEKEEITVGVCGNEKDIRILGMMKIIPKCEGQQKRFLYSLEQKRQWQEKIKYEPEETIPKKVRELIKEYALQAYVTLELRDLARMDFRVDNSNIPKIIDINPLPGLSPRYSDLPILYSLKGKSYSELIKLLLRESLRRQGFSCENFGLK